MFVKKPHIPSGRVTVAALSGEYKDICSALNAIGIHVIELSRHPKLPSPVASHGDLLLHHLGQQKIAAVKGEGDYIEQLRLLGFEVIIGAKGVDRDYPFDIPLDCLRVGKNLFGKAKHIDPVILKYCDENKIDIVDVKQGYTKCSACIVNENAVITSDSGIEKACRGKGIDTLLIRGGYLSLPGYSHGFIGGCAGLLDRNILGFTGDIANHPDADKILDFLRAHDVTAVPLRKGMPIDIGGILPLIQMDQ